MREVVKRLARGLALILVSPLVLCYHLQALLSGKDRALEDWSECLALIPGLPGRYLRCAFLRFCLAYCHPSVYIGFGSLFSKTGTRLEENVYIGPRCHIGLAHLERDVLLAAGVHVPSGANIHGHADTGIPIRDQEGKLHCVHIGAGCWLGSTAVVLADVGEGTIVGAGAVVTSPLPSGVIAGGVPAKVIRVRQPNMPSQEITP